MSSLAWINQNALAESVVSPQGIGTNCFWWPLVTLPSPRMRYQVPPLKPWRGRFFFLRTKVFLFGCFQSGPKKHFSPTRRKRFIGSADVYSQNLNCFFVDFFFKILIHILTFILFGISWWKVGGWSIYIFWILLIIGITLFFEVFIFLGGKERVSEA